VVFFISSLAGIQGIAMDLTNWLPPITTTFLLALALWLGRKLIETRLTKSIEHEFNTKLEALRAEFRAKEELLKADLRSKETEIATLRGGAMTAMASRQMALDKRRLEAVEQLWSTITALGPAKVISAFMTVVKFDVAAEDATKDPKIREAFEFLSTAFRFDPNKIDFRGSVKARPFVSPMAWALFSAYQAIAMQAFLKLQIIKSGLGKKLIDLDAIAKLVKAALPHQAEYIDKFGDTGYHFLFEELEKRLLDEMQKMLAGVESDKASVEQAAEIVRLSYDLMDSAQKSSMPHK
jgi:hypothetical protein